MARRPSIKSPCVADRHSLPFERTAEFSSRFGGGLFNVMEGRGKREVTTATIFKTDPGLEVIVGSDDRGEQPPVYIQGKRVPDIRKLRELLERVATLNAGPANVERDGTVRRPTQGQEIGDHILIAREDWQALVELRAFMDGETEA